MVRLTLQISEHLEQELRSAAAAGNRTPDEEAVRWLEEANQHRQRVHEELERLRTFRETHRLGTLTDELLAKAKAERP